MSAHPARTPVAALAAVSSLVLILSSPAALASAPMSVWATLDRAEITQRRGEAPRLVVEGTFITREGRKPEAGRLVYTCAGPDFGTCLGAWVDVVKAAESGACVGWGQPSVATPSPTPLAKAAPAAIVWPVGMGVAQSRWRCNATP